MAENKPVILYVEDDPDFLEALRVVLEANGFEMVGATSGEEGLRRYKESTPDFILIDLMMEEVDAGTNLAKELRALRNEAPVYMLSSVGDDMNLTIDSDEIGFDGVLQKPMDPDALIALIRSKLKS
jgi:two-component system response regulator MtrA